MKRIISLLLLVVLALTCTACGGQDTKGSSSSAKTASSGQPAGKDTLVVYFSCTGHTKGLASDVAEICKADLFEIQPEHPYSQADLNYKDESTRAAVEQKDLRVRPGIKNRIENLAQYKNIVIAYPIWLEQAPRIVYTFVESYDFTGKNVLPLCTSDGSDIGTSADLLKEHASTGRWRDGRAFPGGVTKSDLKEVLKKAQFVQ